MHKLFRIVPLIGLALGVPLAITSCANTTSEVLPPTPEPLPPTPEPTPPTFEEIVKGDNIKVVYKVMFNGAEQQIEKQGLVVFKNQDYLSLKDSAGKQFNIQSTWIVSIEKI